MIRYSIIVFLLSALTMRAQTAADVFRDETKLSLLGLDFSKAKFIGDVSLQTDEDIQKFTLAINYLFRDEADKYYFPRALRKDRIEDALEVTIEKNKSMTNRKDQVINSVDFTRPLNRRELDEIVASYDYRGNDGIGLMLIADKIDKYNKKFFIWYTFVNMKEKKILFTEYKHEAPGGFGPRNYWARAIHMNIIQIKAHDYKVWKSKYGSPNQ
jgi:hypothetical protein